MQGLRVIRSALESEGAAWAAAIAGGAWRRGSLLLKHDGPTSVHRARILGREVVVKVWELGPKARLQAMLGSTRALRHWRGAARLRKAGIATAWTWAVLRGQLDGRPVEVLVMEALPGKSILQHLADRDLTTRQEHAVAAAIGSDIALLARHVLQNRDHKPSNLILTNPAKPAIAIIDCVAIRRGIRADRMLASLVIEPSGVGLRPRRALMMRVIRECARNAPDILEGGQRRWVRELWRRVAAIVQAHGDPTPRVNPLSNS